MLECGESFAKTIPGSSSSISKGGLVPRLRRFIARSFWVVPFVYGLPAVSFPLLILHPVQGLPGYIDQNAELGPRQVAMVLVARVLLYVLAVSPGAMCITSVFAAVQLVRGKRSGRIWAIACGIAFLACSVPVLGASAIAAYYAENSFEGCLGLLILGMIQTAAGILILIAFRPRESANEDVLQSSKPARVKGDGTHSLSIYVAVAVMMGGCWVGDSLCRRWSVRANLPPSDPSLLYANLTWSGALVLAVVLHELGHMVAGKMVGMKILSFRIGPLQAALEEGRWRLVLPRTLQSMLAAGVSMIPLNPFRYERRQQIIAAAGGISANLLVGIIALAGFLTAKGSSYESSWDFLGELATIDFAFFIINLIPVQTTATYSDGARIYQILTGSVVEDYRRILAMTQATTMTPYRPRDFDIDLIEKVAATNTPGFDQVFLLLVASDYYFDRGEMGSACQKTLEAEAVCDQKTPYWAENCGSIVLRAACLLGDRAIAEKWWQRSLSAKHWNPGKKNHFPACSYYVIAGRLPEAEEAWRAELEKANQLPDTGERAFDLYYLERLREMLDEAAMQAGKTLAVMPGG